jgi:steroid delta-isomerase-like uncharacterized protein
MSTESKDVVHRWFEEVWNAGRVEAIDELFAEDGIAHGLSDQGGDLRGPEGFKPFFNRFHSAFPDLQVVIEDAVAEGEKVAVRCRVQGKHTGEGLGFAATHQPVAITGMSFVRVRDGKIVEAWNNFDFMTLFQQLGVIQSTAGSADAMHDSGI